MADRERTQSGPVEFRSKLLPIQILWQGQDIPAIRRRTVEQVANGAQIGQTEKRVLPKAGVVILNARNCLHPAL